MSAPDRAATFDEITAMDSTALFKPEVVSLVVTNTDTQGPNVMAASWFMLAGYDPLRYLLAVDHETYTYELIEANPEFVLAAPSTTMVDALAVAGTVSGRDIDKLDHLGLDTVPGASVDVPLLADAIGNIECSVVESFTFEGCTYYFGSVESAYVTAGGLDERVLSLDEDVLAYMGSNWGAEADEKYRYYAEMASEDMYRLADEAALSRLPEHVRESEE